MENKFFNQQNDNDDTNSSLPNNQSSYDSHGNSMEDYSDQISVEQSSAKEAMFDRRNPFVRIFLILLGLFAGLGTLYYIYVYFTTMK